MSHDHIQRLWRHLMRIKVQSVDYYLQHYDYFMRSVHVKIESHGAVDSHGQFFTLSVSATDD